MAFLKVLKLIFNDSPPVNQNSEMFFDTTALECQYDSSKNESTFL